MSDVTQPTAAAMRAAEATANAFADDRLFTTDAHEIAAIIDAEIRPLVEALEGIISCYDEGRAVSGRLAYKARTALAHATGGKTP